MNTSINRAWCFLVLISMFVMWSCRHSGQTGQASLPQVEQGSILVDTSFWLKDTRGIRDILEDRKGNLWFSSPDYVAKFDGTSIQYFSENEGLTFVGNLHEDSKGGIWVENGFKIFQYDGSRFLEVELDSLQPSGDIWFQRGFHPKDTGYLEHGIYHISPSGLEFLPYPLKEHPKNRALYVPTTKVYLGKDGTIWAGAMEKVFGLQGNSFISIGREEMGRQSDERQIGVRGIFVDSEGRLWMADNGAGIFTYDGKKVTNFTKKHQLDRGDAEGSTLHRAFSIAEDAEGKMWFGTVYSGIWRYDPETNEFKNYTKEDGVISENIWTIYKRKNGELLFAGETPGGVYRFNGDTFDRVH